MDVQMNQQQPVIKKKKAMKMKTQKRKVAVHEEGMYMHTHTYHKSHGTQTGHWPSEEPENLHCP